MHIFFISPHSDVVFLKTVPLAANTGRMQSALTSFSLSSLCLAALTFGLFKLLHCKKRQAFFPVPSWDVTLAGQGEFG